MDSSSYEHDEEKQGFLDLLQAPEQRVALERNCWGNVRWCLRLVMEVLMAIAIAVLATRSIRDQEADELRPVPKCKTIHHESWIRTWVADMNDVQSPEEDLHLQPESQIRA